MHEAKTRLSQLVELAGTPPFVVSLKEDDREEAAKYGIERVPGIVLRGRNGATFKFYGMPGGSEFPSFVESITDISRGETLLSPESVKALASLKEDVTVRVFVTPT